MPFKQIAVLVIAGFFILGISSRVYSLSKERIGVREDLKAAQEKAAIVEQDRARIDSQAQFLADPDNLEKELRARLNYHKPGERVIIIVPAPEPTSSSSTPSIQ